MEEGVNSSIIYLIYCKNLCKCHNVPLSGITIITTIIKEFSFIKTVLASVTLGSSFFTQRYMYTSVKLHIYGVVAGRKNMENESKELIEWTNSDGKQKLEDIYELVFPI
jgi:hypothetical protein